MTTFAFDLPVASQPGSILVLVAIDEKRSARPSDRRFEPVSRSRFRAGS